MAINGRSPPRLRARIKWGWVGTTLPLLTARGVPTGVSGLYDGVRRALGDMVPRNRMKDSYQVISGVSP